MTEHNPSERSRPSAVGSAAMKAFAHPLRMAMYQRLIDHGSATATTLARQLDESTGQTSYHLRQLARHGFVEEDAERGTGRERWWKAAGFSVNAATMAEEPAMLPVVTTYLRTQLEQRTAALREWYARGRTESAEWIAASVDSTATVAMTAEEAREMVGELEAVADRHVTRAKEREKGEPDSRRRVRIQLDVFPLPTEPPPPGA
ncbi:winged helix-turn-helix domain-containing protein [Brachybacterium sp.]|uniref:winged helix-turn-helix domain-containing protein n=1 Tax=Brachybacterium sp. TaxID=1891286 RepID=UPI003F90EF8F